MSLWVSAITSAIEALDDGEGVSKVLIDKHIEANWETLLGKKEKAKTWTRIVGDLLGPRGGGKFKHMGGPTSSYNGASTWALAKDGEGASDGKAAKKSAPAKRARKAKESEDSEEAVESAMLSPREPASPRKPQASPKKPAASPKRAAASPAKPAASPAKPAASPKRAAASPKRAAASPAKPAASPKRAAASPAKPAASPAKPAASPKRAAASPAKPAASPAKRAASPKRAAASPAKKTEAKKGAGKGQNVEEGEEGEESSHERAPSPAKRAAKRAKQEKPEPPAKKGKKAEAKETAGGGREGAGSWAYAIRAAIGALDKGSGASKTEIDSHIEANWASLLGKKEKAKTWRRIIGDLLVRKGPSSRFKHVGGPSSAYNEASLWSLADSGDDVGVGDGDGDGDAEAAPHRSATRPQRNKRKAEDEDEEEGASSGTKKRAAAKPKRIAPAKKAKKEEEEEEEEEEGSEASEGSRLSRAQASSGDEKPAGKKKGGGGRGKGKGAGKGAGRGAQARRSSGGASKDIAPIAEPVQKGIIKRFYQNGILMHHRKVVIDSERSFTVTLPVEGDAGNYRWLRGEIEQAVERRKAHLGGFSLDGKSYSLSWRDEQGRESALGDGGAEQWRHFCEHVEELVLAVK
eukprot:tig00000204_g17755.t1